MGLFLATLKNKKSGGNVKNKDLTPISMGLDFHDSI